MLVQTACLVLVGGAAINHFGWLDGLAIFGAVFLLMPYDFRGGR